MQKIRFIFPLFLKFIFKILFSLREKPQKNSDKKPSFFVFVPSLLLFHFFFQHFPFSFITFSMFTFYIPFLSVSKTLQLFTLYVHSLPFCSSICSSVVFFSLLVVSVYEKHVFDTSAFSKAFNLFVRHIHKFVCFCMLVLLSVFFFFFFQFFFFLCVFSCVFWTFSFFDLFLEHLFFPCFFFFVVLFECISFLGRKILFDFIILFLPFLSPFTYSPLFSKTTFFTKSCLLSLFFFGKKSFLLLLVFSLHQRKLCH